MNATERRIHDAAVRLFAERGHTELSVSDLASEAGVARGTLYRNVESVDGLYEQVRMQLAIDVHERVNEVMGASGITDPALRLATGIRLLVRHAHENPAMGRFFVRFGLTDESLREMLSGPPLRDLNEGIDAGRYTAERGRDLSIASMIMGTTVAAIWMALEGHQGWREASSDAAELILIALGIAPGEARALATTPLPSASLTA
ncbi:TetR/AcrR family transcriptional regulator [Nocardioides jiangxiensis]|uniref:Helix-turn-helix domain-containing protein n=1 Tax=Nocardioides jiangxiensis TaxID=3064524 RepID=A0ABT9AY61_9ACTN|nr:TetR/AcrR family transcriptional regulator [Nocardioides sp. WY-20]MDO7867263.1 helix-turn-helix domain-containing protein [Nocardioides sp. WY-20]